MSNLLFQVTFSPFDQIPRQCLNLFPYHVFISCFHILSKLRYDSQQPIVDCFLCSMEKGQEPFQHLPTGCGCFVADRHRGVSPNQHFPAAWAVLFPRQDLQKLREKRRRQNKKRKFAVSAAKMHRSLSGALLWCVMLWFIARSQVIISVLNKRGWWAVVLVILSCTCCFMFSQIDAYLMINVMCVRVWTECVHLGDVFQIGLKFRFSWYW